MRRRYQSLKKTRDHTTKLGEASSTGKARPLPLSGRNQGGDEDPNGQSYYPQGGKTHC